MTESAAGRLREGTEAHRLDLYRRLEAEASAPWFLDEVEARYQTEGVEE